MPGALTSLMVGMQVLFVGDSITAGQVADPGLGFVERFAAEHPEWSVHNAGCGGTTTRDWTLPKLPGAPAACSFRGAFEQLAARYVDADFVHILIGTNDAVGFFEPSPVAPAEYASNILTLAGRFPGDVFVSIPPPFPDPATVFQQRLDLYALELYQLASLPNPAFRIGADFSGLDRAHPTNVGHAWMATLLGAALIPERSGALLFALVACVLAAKPGPGRSARSAVPRGH